MGAVSLANVVQGIAGSYRTVEADVTFSASYATGGDTVPLNTLGLNTVLDAHVLSFVSKTGSPVNAHGAQVVLAGTTTAPKLKVFNGSVTEVANATNLSTVPAVRMEFRGK